MRVMPSRYTTQAKPVMAKGRPAAQVKHLSAPLKGLSLSSKLTTADPLTAPVLDNWIVEENRILARPGTRLTVALAGAKPVFCLVPYYGIPSKLAAASDNKLFDLDGSVIKSGFTSDDWHWTAFSNLSAVDYTIMVNGQNGVWSWNGGTGADPAPVAASSLVNANPARIYVAAADIGKFQNGTNVIVAGATGDMVAANGTKQITSVGVPANSITLVGVDLSGAAAPQTTGVTVNPPAPFMKESVSPPAGTSHIFVDRMQIVLSHMNRLWFADSTYLSVYYLPLQQKSGQLKELPLNAVFKRGGTIRAMYTWTLDGGMGLDDQLVIFTTNGEAAIYAGTDPDTDLTLIGVYRFDSPMSKHSVVQYGGELYALISTGLVPMSTLMRAETENLGKQDVDVTSEFYQHAIRHRDKFGWQAFLNHSSGRLYCNMPIGGMNQYRQMIRFMPKPVWARWSGVPARCWAWIDNRVFFGTDNGRVKEMHPSFLNDDGGPIRVDVQGAWSTYGTPAIKHFKMVKAYIQTDGQPRPFLDMKVDYDTTRPTNQPETSPGTVGAEWDTATWDVDDWASAVRNRSYWTGVKPIGQVGGPRLMALVRDCEFAITGFDVIYETGSVLG